MAKRIRPVSIRLFEALVYLGLAVGIVATALSYRDVAQQFTWLELALGEGVIVGVNLLFVWLIAWRANNVFKWIFVVLVLVGNVFYAIELASNPQPSTLAVMLTSAVYVLATIEVLLLFRRDARDWFACRQQIDPGIFG